MALSSATSRVSYTGDGATSVYAYTFRIFANTDLLVTVKDTSDVETTLALTTDYTVSGVGEASGGNVTLVDSSQAWLDGDGDLLTDYVLTIRRVRPLTQTTDIRNQGDFLPETHEDSFDHGIMVAQQQQDELDRSIKLPETLDPSDFDLNLPTNFADSPNQAVLVNADGDGLTFGADTSAGADSIPFRDVEYLTNSDSPKTLDSDDRGKVFVCDTSSGAITINLPGISGLTLSTSFTYAIKKSTVDSNNVTINPNGTDTVDGNTDIELTVIDEGVLLVPDAGQSPDEWNAFKFSAASGTGVSGINYIANPDAEGSTTGWAAYADAAAATPADGTGGSANITLTQAGTIRGSSSFRITKDAADRQGEGVSYDFTIDNADRAQMLNISFDYGTTDSDFAAGDSSDIKVFIYDVTNTALIPVTPNSIQGAAGTNLFWNFSGTFQTASDSLSYRLILHIPTTNAAAWTWDFDNVKVGPQSTLLASPVTDYTQYTPTFTAFGSVSVHSVWYRRSGDSIEVLGRFTAATATGAEARISLPSGLTIDSTKVPAARVVGNFASTTAPSTTSDEYVLGNGGESYVTFSWQNSGSSMSNLNGSSITSTGDVIFKFSLPIEGWGSPIVMSNDTDTRVVAAHYEISGSTANTALASGSNEVIDFDTKVFDTHGAVTTGASWVYTCPVSGKYRVSANAAMAATTADASNDSFNITARKNTSDDTFILGVYRFPDASTSLAASASGSVIIDCAAGDTIDITGFHNAGSSTSLSTDGSDTYVSIDRISGPAAIAPTETIAALYESNTARAISNSSATTAEFLMEDKIFDTHGAYNNATAIFTCPISGKYRVTAHSRAVNGGGTWNAGERWINQVFKNGSLERVIGDYTNTSATGHTIPVSANGSCLVDCAAGDTLEVRIYQDSGGSENTDGNQDHNWVQYERVGN